MAKKKVVRKATRKVSKKETKRKAKPMKVVRAKSSSTNQRFHQILEPRANRRTENSSKIKVVFNNLLLFALIFGLSVFFYNFVADLFFKNVFLLLAILSGFVGLAFVIVLLIFLFLRLLKK